MVGWLSIVESDGGLYGDSWMARLLARLAAATLDICVRIHNK
jgi:hypothetical protein